MRRSVWGVTWTAIGGRLAVSGGDDGTVRVWDLAAGQPLGEPLTGHYSLVYEVAVGELDGRPIAVSGGDDGTVRMWDLAAGQQLGQPLTGHDGVVRALAVGELDGRPIAVSGGDDGTVRRWYLAGSELSVINVGSAVQAVAMWGGTCVLAARAGVMTIEVRNVPRVA